jgi:hypothetical protein
MGQTATCLPKLAMSALTPTPEVIWRHRQRPRDRYRCGAAPKATRASIRDDGGWPHDIPTAAVEASSGKQPQTVELPAIASPGSLIAIENEPPIIGLPDLNQRG